MAGETHLCADAMKAVRTATGPGVPTLTARESSIVRCIASGMRTAEIAAVLGIAGATVETHRKNIKVKLGLRTIAELTQYALREGLIKA